MDNPSYNPFYSEVSHQGLPHIILSSPGNNDYFSSFPIPDFRDTVGKSGFSALTASLLAHLSKKVAKV